jgi:CheY-like chemotaxis protein
MANPTILVADDDAPLRATLIRVLEAIGYEILEAEDGLAVMGYIGQCPPDAVILDLRMPGQDGLRTLEQIRELEKPIRVVAMSGAAGGVDQGTLLAKALAQGADAALAKPFSLDELLEVLAGMGLEI